MFIPVVQCSESTPANMCRCGQEQHRLAAVALDSTLTRTLNHAQAASRELPVMVCCETYKFHERVQLDSITQNELGDPDVLTSVPFRPEAVALAGWRSIPRLGESLISLSHVMIWCQVGVPCRPEWRPIPPLSSKLCKIKRYKANNQANTIIV